MLRLIVLLLLLANGGYYAWSQGYLLAWGAGPVQQSEPQRLSQQIKPEAIRVLKADDLKRAETAAAQAPRPPECLASTALDDATVTALRQVLDSWPAGSWNFEPLVEPARWIVYMGKYAGVEQVARKRAELRQLGVSFEAPANPELEPGLSLGGFTSEAAANQGLAALGDRGVHTARVVQERPEQRGQRLVLSAVDDSLRPRLDELKAPLNSRALRACR
ncbi:SPOR domain-containing protein [Ramlibacter sp. XY19]|uniref:SPOR domain-containing protein n=1 Tax=Ramlibacter paludis TaxID=2908000 RepID=UPI0023DC03E3|nr:SPOR domain-containing protein [Ramlibacter paludis]MCG2594727.1 SPOR domain-containing protein [Ramlibacter paludis]